MSGSRLGRQRRRGDEPGQHPQLRRFPRQPRAHVDRPHVVRHAPRGRAARRCRDRPTRARPTRATSSSRAPKDTIKPGHWGRSTIRRRGARAMSWPGAAGAVVFDLDGTLVDSATDLAAAASALAVELGGRPLTRAEVVGHGRRRRRGAGPPRASRRRGLDPATRRAPWSGSWRSTTSACSTPRGSIPGLRRRSRALDPLLALTVLTNKPRGPAERLLEALRRAAAVHRGDRRRRSAGRASPIPPACCRPAPARRRRPDGAGRRFAGGRRDRATWRRALRAGRLRVRRRRVRRARRRRSSRPCPRTCPAPSPPRFDAAAAPRSLNPAVRPPFRRAASTPRACRW